ncbi:hypothetical protein PISL3812_09815 [Talaromyces islandicus]|uniref:Uncharacterized protein n=1 Tax=Talaromyces islandicus TaxID=28573 RepID=A0A0U1MAX4_TALIS|nr:hypothetical protein PISL3812_09815 [Talaromyces islandicus]
MIQSNQPTHPFFTFIDHDDDLPSKRIRNINARKAIRSHVMRHVRLRERLAGRKRITRRDPNESQLSEIANPSACSGEVLAVDSPVSHFEQSLGLVKPRPRRPVKYVLAADLTLQRDRYLDPFDTLPGVSELSSLMNALLHYYVSVFIPMTFPTETISFRDTRATLHTSVRKALADTGEFYGLMTVAAAHKGAVNNQGLSIVTPSPNSYQVIFDSNYCVMKGKCLRVLNEKLGEPSQALDHVAIQTVIHLITSSLILGFYQEAQTHLGGLKRMVDLCGGISSPMLQNSGLIHAIIWSDLKSATGSMTKPMFLLPWKPTSLSAKMMQQIRPSPSSQLIYLCLSFYCQHVQSLSKSLMDIIGRLRDALLFQNFIQEQNKTQPDKDGTASQLHQLYLFMSEIEHDLLSYPPNAAATGHTHSHAETLNPKEAMTRMGCICLLNSIIIVTHPAAGMGRTLTRFMKKEICVFASLYTSFYLPQADLDLLSWVLFIGAQGSLEQVDHAWFIGHLRQVIKLRQWKEWADVVDVLQQYIYIPRLHEEAWRCTWKKANAHSV